MSDYASGMEAMHFPELLRELEDRWAQCSSDAGASQGSVRSLCGRAALRGPGRGACYAGLCRRMPIELGAVTFNRRQVVPPAWPLNGRPVERRSPGDKLCVERCFPGSDGALGSGFIFLPATSIAP